MFLNPQGKPQGPHSGGFLLPNCICQHFCLDKWCGWWGMTCGMITTGEFLASLVLVGLGGLWLGHFVGKRAGWCERDTEAISDSWAEDDEICASVDHYGESEN